jgi:hypothetical protein
MIQKGRLTPCKAIHQFCIECSGGQKQVRECPSKECPLWIYRMGKNPKRKGIGGKSCHRRLKGKKCHIEKILGTQVTKINPVEFGVKGNKRIRLIVEDIEKEK